MTCDTGTCQVARPFLRRCTLASLQDYVQQVADAWLQFWAPNRFRLARGNIHLHYGKNGQIKVTKWSMAFRVSNSVFKLGGAWCHLAAHKHFLCGSVCQSFPKRCCSVAWQSVFVEHILDLDDFLEFLRIWFVSELHRCQMVKCPSSFLVAFAGESDDWKSAGA